MKTGRQQIKIAGVALARGLTPYGLYITKDTVVSLAPGAKLTRDGSPIGEILEIECKDGAWYYTAKIGP